MTKEDFLEKLSTGYASALGENFIPNFLKDLNEKLIEFHNRHSNDLAPDYVKALQELHDHIEKSDTHYKNLFSYLKLPGIMYKALSDIHLRDYGLYGTDLERFMKNFISGLAGS
jgi:hypothetical protein